MNRLAEAFKQDHPDSATTFKDLNHRHGGPYQSFANLNGVRKEAQAIRLCSPDLFGAAWTVFYAYVPGKTIDRLKNWTQNQDERYLRASSPFFPAANSGFPTDASPGTQDVKIYVLNSVLFPIQHPPSLQWFEPKRHRGDPAAFRRGSFRLNLVDLISSC